jgi:predicted amidophosphoribosyltransferase
LFTFGTMCLVIVSMPYAGALVAICLRRHNSTPGTCQSCGYALYGLPSAVCPECGRPFSADETEVSSESPPHACAFPNVAKEVPENP